LFDVLRKLKGPVSAHIWADRQSSAKAPTAVRIRSGPQ